MCIDGSPVLTVKDIDSLTVRHYTKEDKTRLKKKATRSHLFAYIIIAVWLILFTLDNFPTTIDFDAHTPDSEFCKDGTKSESARMRAE